MDWKKDLDSNLRKHLEFQIAEANKNSKSFKKAKEPSKAQLWVAVGNLSKLISSLNLRIKELEKNLLEKDSAKRKKKVGKKGKNLKELEKSLAMM